MISEGYKKQLIVNAYNTQLLSDRDKIIADNLNNILNTNKRIKNILLFRIEGGRMLDYKYKPINDNILWFLNYLTDIILSIYNYGGNEKSDIQKNISSNIKKTLEHIQDIEDSPDYAEYLEDIYD